MDRHRVRNRCKLRCAWTEWPLLARRVSSQPNINSVAIGGEADMSRLPASYQSDATDPACVKTHTIAKCKKYNSPPSGQTAWLPPDSTPWCAIFWRPFYFHGERWS